MTTIIKSILLIILVFLAFIGVMTIAFLFTATEYDEDDLDNKESK
jgi:flagellar basal body-associated protein FliL